MNTNASITKTAMILAVLVLSSFAAISNTTPESKKINAGGETEKTIKNYFKFPGILIPLHEMQKCETQKVEVLFTTGQDGVVNFVLAKTRQPELKREIENQFLKLRLAKVKPDVVNSVVLNFKTI